MRSLCIHSHQLGRISPDWIKLEACLVNNLLEDRVCGQSNSMSMPLQLIAQSDEWLDIPATTDDLNHDVEWDVPLNISRSRIMALCRDQAFLGRCREESGICCGKLGAELYINASICRWCVIRKARQWSVHSYVDMLSYRVSLGSRQDRETRFPYRAAAVVQHQQLAPDRPFFRKSFAVRTTNLGGCITSSDRRLWALYHYRP